jgi:tetratricopeptide (TPR) repeat protein
MERADSRAQTAAILAALTTMRSTRPDLADWCERVPALLELLGAEPWAGRWAQLPDAAQGTAALLAAWAEPEHGLAPKPEALAAFRIAGVLAAQAAAPWPPADHQPALVARCLMGLSANPLAPLRTIAHARDAAALAEALDEPNARAIDMSALLADLPAPALVALLSAAAATAHPQLPQIVAAAHSTGRAAPDHGAALVAALLPQHPVEAAALAESIVAAWPKHLSARLALARAYGCAGDTAAAAPLLAGALAELDRLAAAAAADLAATEQALGRPTQARTAWARALARNPAHADAAVALARQALASGRRAYAERILAALVARSAGAELPALLPALHQAALEAPLRAALARAAAAQPNHPTTLYYTGLLQQRDGALDQAQATLTRAIVRAPRWWAPRLAYADLLRSRGALDPAAAEYRAVLERDPANTQALIGLAQIGAAKGDLPGALALAEALVRSAPAAAEHHALHADMLMAAGRAAEAIAPAAHALARDATPAHTVRLASAQLASGAPHDAVATLQAARAQAGDQPDLLALLATSAAAAQNWTAALDAWSTLFQHHRDAASARGAAQAARSAGDLAQARAWLARALRCTPHDSNLWIEIAAAHSAAARPRAAVRAYLHAIKAGAPASLQRNLAQAYLQAGDTHAARACLEGYIAGAPQDALAWHLLGRVCMLQADRAGALAAAERLATLPALPSPIACWLIDTLAAAGLRGRAREVADATIAVAPHDAALRARRAGLLLNAGAIAEARADALAALTRQRDLAAARLILARIQLREGGYAAANTTLAPLVGDPRHADVVGPLLAEALEGCGDMAEALPYAERALARTPADPALRARVARLLLATDQPERVVALLAGQLDQPELLIVRAQAAAALGMAEAAEHDAQAAAGRAPDSAVIALAATAIATTTLAPAGARQQWLALLKRFPADRAIRLRAAQATFADGDARATIGLLRPLVASGPASGEVAGLLGQAYVYAGHVHDGVRTLRYALRHAPDAAARTTLQLALANAYVQHGWTDDAHAMLEALLADKPDHSEARRMRARLALAAADLPAAAADLALLDDRDADTAELRATLAARQGDWDRALAAQRQACALELNPARIARLAELCAAAERPAEQIAALESLTTHAPAPAHWAALAQAYAAADRRPAARTAWESALDASAPAEWWAAYGHLLLADADPHGASAALGRALALDPADAASAATLADICAVPSERVELLRQATRSAPKDATLWRKLAHALDAAGAGDEARQALRQASALAPDDPVAAESYANALLAAGERLDAVEVLEQACAAPDAPAFLLGRLADVLVEGLPFIGDLVRLPAAPDPARQRLTARADLLLEQARTREPEAPQWWLRAARLRLVAGDRRGAHRLLAELPWDRLNEADHSSARALRALALAGSGELQLAAADARELLGTPDGTAMRAILAEAAYANGDLAAAREHARVARDNGADSPALLATLGRAALALGHAAEACEALELALEQGNQAEWLVALSNAYAQLDRRDRALEYAARAVRAAPNVASYQQQLATLYQQQRQLHDARAALIRALSLQPDMAPWHAQMAEICDALGMAQAAAQSLSQARALAPHDPAIKVIGAQLRAAQGDTTGALAEYREALAGAPDRVEWHVAAAELARTSRQSAEFLKHAHAVVEHAPNHAPHWQLLAEAAEQNRDAAAAMAVLEQGLTHCANDRGLTLRAARQALVLNRPSRAQALIDAWLDHSPDDGEAWELAGLSAQALGDTDAGQRALERAIRVAPRRASAHAALARLSLALGDHATALRAAANASDYEPANRGYVVLLAHALHAAQRLDEARAIIRALPPEALPLDGEIYRWYAELQLLDGDPGRAISALEHAIEQLPAEPELYLWAGRAHRQLRHYRRAITHLRRAIRLRPSYPEAIIELSSLGPLAFAAHAARGDGAEEALPEHAE